MVMVALTDQAKAEPRGGVLRVGEGYVVVVNDVGAEAKDVGRVWHAAHGGVVVGGAIRAGDAGAFEGAEGQHAKPKLPARHSGL